MITTYIAESVPAYAAIKGYPHRPTTDEGYAMSAPVLVAHGQDEIATRDALAMHLIHCTAGMAADRQKIYNAASAAIAAGVDAVQISGRVFRIRTQTREG
jgi:hypothetical protein